MGSVSNRNKFLNFFNLCGLALCRLFVSALLCSCTQKLSPNIMFHMGIFPFSIRHFCYFFYSSSFLWWLTCAWNENGSWLNFLHPLTRSTQSSNRNRMHNFIFNTWEFLIIRVECKWNVFPAPFLRHSLRSVHHSDIIISSINYPQQTFIPFYDFQLYFVHLLPDKWKMVTNANVHILRLIWYRADLMSFHFGIRQSRRILLSFVSSSFCWFI